MAKDILTDAEVELEIERLKESPAVKLAQREQAFKNRRRKYLYQLRWYEKHGKELMSHGFTLDDFDVSKMEQEEISE